KQADTGIVYQHIDWARELQRGSDAVGPGDVQRTNANVIRSSEQTILWSTHGGDDFPAPGQEVAGGFEAVAGRTAGDQYGFHLDLLSGFDSERKIGQSFRTIDNSQ